MYLNWIDMRYFLNILLFTHRIFKNIIFWKQTFHIPKVCLFLNGCSLKYSFVYLLQNEVCFLDQEKNNDF